MSNPITQTSFFHADMRITAQALALAHAFPNTLYAIESYTTLALTEPLLAHGFNA